ncbi:MAG: hypothetical protein AAB447_03450 [Patescibacteria group bacterium]
MKKHIGRTVLQIIALVFIVFGIIGLFLPFLQGIIFLVIGLYLLSLISPRIREHIHAWGRRHSFVGRVLARLEGFNVRLRRWFHLD